MAIDETLMTMRRRVCFILGTRPEVIKCWPVIRLLETLDSFDVQTIFTGQHRELLHQAAKLLRIPATVDLDVMTTGQTLEHLTSVLCARIAGALRELSPDCVLVQGDTTSVFVGALASFYAGIPVGHIEAGLRTDSAAMPFPEEMNRRLTASLAEYHFAPTKTAKEALLRENIPQNRIWVTGNTGIDALRIMSETLDDYPIDDALDRIIREAPGPIIAVTVHRRENRAYMADIASALAMIVDRHEQASIVFPVHPAPAVRRAFAPILEAHPQCHLIEPLDYANFVRLLTRCDIVLTDSGGVQEEGPYLGKPVLVMRRATERPEAVESGTARLIGQDPDGIFWAVSELLTDSAAYAAMAKAVSPYGDGYAAQRIADILTDVSIRPDTRVGVERRAKSEPRTSVRAVLQYGEDLLVSKKPHRLKPAAR